MTQVQRLMAHLFGSWFQLSRRFPSTVLDEITAAIAAGEATHKGEVCIAIESRLAPLAVLEGLDAATRARQVFAQLRVWDTECNSGVLFYVLLAEHRIEIVADRGIAAKVGSAEWDSICQSMREAYAINRWREGTLKGVAAAHELLRQHFPGNDKVISDELPNRPTLL